MKRIALFFGLVTMLLVSSCSKDSYTCTCTYFDGTTNKTETYDIGKKSSEDDAKEDCDAQKLSLENAGATNVTCVVSKS